MTCPWCGSDDVAEAASYGSLLMTAQWFCSSCGSPFERIRHRGEDAGAEGQRQRRDRDHDPILEEAPVAVPADLVAVSTRSDGVRWLTLNRPDVRNAIDLALQRALAAALQEAATDSGVRAIVLTGAGPAFSAGGDLARLAETDPIAFRWASHDLTTTIGLVERIEKPVLAAINGVATGAGLQLALACDLRIASDHARFLWREGHLGLLPAHGGIARLVHMVGLGPARDLVLGGGDVDAPRAHALGLVSEVVGHEHLEKAVTAAVGRILGGGVQAYAAAKRVLAIAASTDVQTGMLAETLGQSLLVGTPEHGERLAAARRRAGGP